MPQEDYIPKSDVERVLWLNNFAAKLPEHALVFDLVAAELTSVENDALAWQYLVHAADAIKTSKKVVIAYKNMVRDNQKQADPGSFPVINLGMPPVQVKAGIFKRIRMLVRRLKAHPNYTEAIGNDLGIIHSQTVFVPDEYKTQLTVQVLSGCVSIGFVKGGAEAIAIYSRLEGENGWKKLDTVMYSPYIDKRPLHNPPKPEARLYMANGVVKDKEIGHLSSIVRVVFGG